MNLKPQFSNHSIIKFSNIKIRKTLIELDHLLSPVHGRGLQEVISSLMNVKADIYLSNY